MDPYQDYREWLNDATVIELMAPDGRIVRRLSSKRGNLAYARNKRKVLNDLEDCFSKLDLDEPLFDRDTLRKTRALLITFTYDPKCCTIEDAWKNLSKDLAVEKVLLKRVLGVTSIASITVKESQENGYPAPHMLIIMNEKVRVRAHNGKDGKRYLIDDDELWKKMKSTWKHGYTDIRGVVHGRIGKRSPLAYVMKYMIKAVGTESDIGFKSNAWCWKNNLRSMHISKKFKEVVRLDTMLNESQQIIKEKYEFVGYLRCTLDNFDKVIMLGHEIDGENGEVESIYWKNKGKSVILGI